MHKIAVHILSTIQETLYSRHTGANLSKEEKLEILEDLINELGVEKHFVETED